MSISKGSLKRVNEGGLASLPGNKEKTQGIRIEFQQVPVNQFDIDEALVVNNGLKASIEKWTILVPLIVYVDKSNHLVLISGQQRLSIAKELGMDFVPCQLIHSATQEQIQEIKQELELERDTIHQEKFKIISSVQSSLPDYLL